MYFILSSWVDSKVFAAPSDYEGRQPSVTALALAANVHLTTSTATIQSGARINRDPIFEPTAEQSVEVLAETDILHVNLAGTGNWGIGALARSSRACRRERSTSTSS